MNDLFVKLEANPKAGLQPSNFTPAEAFTTDDRHEVNHAYFTAEDESVLVGTWESAPCKEEIAAYPANEMMSVISGSVTVTGADGRSETYTQGDVFFIGKGTACIWEITQTLRKFYMIAS